ncbi:MULTISPECIES: vegetative protein [unclassified Corallococcus]|uniref:vegetative protein n=1 Tax=unclassified Corallococcus TaxID=2685029 RepID=UPI001F5D75CB|nr:MULTISPECIES: vegetative protein [unclassified Corallococcus]WAS86835.1 vegetative protein [Corallococcus sp. NCRR]
MVRRELQLQLAPVQKAVARMAKGLDALDALRAVTDRLAPLSSRLGAVAGVRTPTLAPEPVARRRPGRPPKATPAAKAAPVKAAPTAKTPAAKAAPVKAPAAKSPGRPPKAAAAEGNEACAVVGCKRQSRSKGYCSAHYQKLRLLIRTGRRPDAWVDGAKPQSVPDVTLPRGRAGSQALKETAKPAAPVAPPKPKAWLRKKGSSGGMVSLT